MTAEHVGDDIAVTTEYFFDFAVAAEHLKSIAMTEEEDFGIAENTEDF